MRRWIRSCGVPVLLFLSLVVAPRAGAWGDGGHQAVCQIAFLELTPAVRNKVKEIMSREGASRSKLFAAACTWPDDQKQTHGTIQNARRDEHFVNVDRRLGSIANESCGRSPKCLFTAIHADEVALRNTKGLDQLIALKFLGHWIGDLHQPLHVSYADDRGGNYIPVSAAAGCGELHAVWDSCIPEKLRRQMGANAGPTNLGTRLQREITDAQRATWRRGNLVEWAEESYAIARKADTKYCLLNGDRCCYDTDSCAYTDGDDISKQTKRLTHLEYGYDDGEVVVVEERLKQAGVRLAAILEAQLQ